MFNLRKRRSQQHVLQLWMNRRVSRNRVIAEARQLRAIFHAKRLLASMRLNVRQNTESSRRVLRTKTLVTIPDIILAKSSTILYRVHTILCYFLRRQIDKN